MVLLEPLPFHQTEASASGLHGPCRLLGGVRQLWALTSITGERPVKSEKRASAKGRNFAAGVGWALRRAGKDARKIARAYGTPLYVWENGRVVATKP
jgi:hypothetical protein